MHYFINLLFFSFKLPYIIVIGNTVSLPQLLCLRSNFNIADIWIPFNCHINKILILIKY